MVKGWPMPCPCNDAYLYLVNHNQSYAVYEIYTLISGTTYGAR